MPELRISSSPLTAAVSNEAGSDIAEMQRKIEALKVQQMRLLTQLKTELANLSRDDPGDQNTSPDRQAREERRQQLTRQLAQIEQRVEQTQGMPRKRYLSPATKVYGKLTMVITVSSQGELLGTEVASSSRNPLLDERAVAIVRSAGPFDPFGAKMRRQADQIVVVSRFMFTRDDALSTRMLAPDK